MVLRVTLGYPMPNVQRLPSDHQHTRYHHQFIFGYEELSFQEVLVHRFLAEVGDQWLGLLYRET
jgi:hypothetical protein